MESTYFSDKARQETPHSLHLFSSFPQSIFNVATLISFEYLSVAAELFQLLGTYAKPSRN